MHDERFAISVRDRGAVGGVTTMLDRCRYAVTAAPHDGTVAQDAYHTAAWTADLRYAPDIPIVEHVSMLCGWCAGREGMPVISRGALTSRGRSWWLTRLPAGRRPCDAELPHPGAQRAGMEAQKPGRAPRTLDGPVGGLQHPHDVLTLDRGQRQWGTGQRRSGLARGYCQIKFATSSAPALCGILAV
jgi:hypothetical protein